MDSQCSLVVNMGERVLLVMNAAAGRLVWAAAQLMDGALMGAIAYLDGEIRKVVSLTPEALVLAIILKTRNR